MIQVLLWLIAIPIVAVLLLFSLRRIIFTLAIFLAAKKRKLPSSLAGIDLPDVLILVSCRNEAGMIHGICWALSQLDYPHAKYQVVLIDDASTDGTGALMKREVALRSRWYVINFQDNLGKAGALNFALNQFPFGEIVFIFDADHRPEPQALRRAVQYFGDPSVAAVSGFTKVANPVASPSAFYCTVESYTNQLVTMRAKDRLGLAPALLGSNCGYRREMLVECGGFRTGAFSEDSDLTVTFYRAGYRVRFAEDALSYQQVPQSIRGYLRQHVRWGRGLNDVARVHSLEILHDPALPLSLRLELLFFTAGYLDRIALMGAGLLMLLSYLGGGPFHFFLSLILFVLLVPFVQIVALFIKERMNTAMWIRLPFVPAFFALDIFAAIRSILDTVLDRSRVWSRTERVEIP